MYVIPATAIQKKNSPKHIGVNKLSERGIILSVNRSTKINPPTATIPQIGPTKSATMKATIDPAIVPSQVLCGLNEIL